MPWPPLTGPNVTSHLTILDHTWPHHNLSLDYLYKNQTTLVTSLKALPLTHLPPRKPFFPPALYTNWKTRPKNQSTHKNSRKNSAAYQLHLNVRHKFFYTPCTHHSTAKNTKLLTSLHCPNAQAELKTLEDYLAEIMFEWYSPLESQRKRVLAIEMGWRRGGGGGGVLSGLFWDVVNRLSKMAT
jgi:hypothetical protein